MDAPNAAELLREADAARPFITAWEGLISQTNWEKGRIISEWRQALIAAECAPQQYSDEAWARTVGQVSGQHVGRLRRVYGRFGAVRGAYSGVYWSHFCAAVDWDDAEMWLEGAVQNDWSVSEMRRTRWETLGSPPGDDPQLNTLVAADLDEDAPALDGPTATLGPPVEGDVRGFDSDFGVGESTRQEDSATASMEGSHDEANTLDDDQSVSAAPEGVRLDADFSSLPTDLFDAFEQLKLAVLRRRIDGWKDVTPEAVADCLAALRTLTLAPAE